MSENANIGANKRDTRECGDPLSQRADAGSGDPAHKGNTTVSPSSEPPPRRLRRLRQVWRDRDGNISYLLTTCVEGRAHVLNDENIFQRLADFLLDSPQRYDWFPRRFVVMPDHLHLIAHQGHAAIRLGQWIKALKAVVGGLVARVESPSGAVNTSSREVVGRVPSRGVRFARLPRSWKWQVGYYDHKFRTSDSESRKWEYVCLNPVRGGLVKRPEDWPFGGEIFYNESGEPKLVRGTPALLEMGMLIKNEPHKGVQSIEEMNRLKAPCEGTRPASNGQTPGQGTRLQLDDP